MTEPRQGYEVPETILRLEFTDPSFDGLVVRARPANWTTIKLARTLKDIDETQPLTPDAFETVAAVIGNFAKSLTDWNLKRPGGEPVPATVGGVGSLEWPWVWQLVDAWMLATSKARAMQRAARQMDEVDLPMEIAS